MKQPWAEIERVSRGALDAWGEGPQCDQTIEECAELIVALRHYARGRLAPNATEVIEEIADVFLMLCQLRLAFGEAEVDAMIRKKLDRLVRRLS